jgi:CxxC motif-containing protein (DUF1111 family)
LKPRIVAAVVLGYAVASVAVAGRTIEADATLTDARTGGDATVADSSRASFTQHVANLTPDQLFAFAFGNRIFSTPWVEAPSSVTMFDGLGPYYSAHSCSGCHVRDGRGRPPEGPTDSSRAVVVKLGAAAGHGDGRPDPRYGSQFSERAARGLAPEGDLVVEWQDVRDSSGVMLRRPRFSIAGTAYGPMDPDTRLSVRIAPVAFGTGLLEAVPDSLLAALEDPGDRDGDGVSGRVHWVADEKGGRRAGHLGWKATQVTVAGQVAAALAGDMGITSPLRPHEEITVAESTAHRVPSGGDPEIEGKPLASLVDYCRTLAVPGRRGLGQPAVASGARLFAEIGCASCHRPTLVTGTADIPALAHQTFHPYTDLLLHDLGPGLDDGMPEGDAAGREWRTAPLWGIGLAQRVNGYRFLLHDGRARTIEEAVLWHGGEAERSRRAYLALKKDARLWLAAFVESL